MKKYCMRPGRILEVDKKAQTRNEDDNRRRYRKKINRKRLREHKSMLFCNRDCKYKKNVSKKVFLFSYFIDRLCKIYAFNKCKPGKICRKTAAEEYSPESESLNKMQQKSLWISAESKLFTKYAQAFMEMPFCIILHFSLERLECGINEIIKIISWDKNWKSRVLRNRDLEIESTHAEIVKMTVFSLFIQFAP